MTGHMELLSYLTSRDPFSGSRTYLLRENWRLPITTDEAICYYCDCNKHRIECFLFPQEQIRRAEVKTSVTPAERLSRGFFVSFD